MKILILLLLCINLPLTYAQTVNNIGRIIKLHGTVYKYNKKQKEKRVIKNGDYIYRYDSLETAKGSIVKIIMQDDTVFQLGPKSQFTFEKFKMRTKNDRDATYNLKYGQLRSLFMHKAPKRSLTIKARNVSMGIRGTEILTNVFKNRQNKFQTDIALISGKLEVKQKIGQQIKQIYLKPGFKFSSKLANKTLNLKQAIHKIPIKMFNQLKRKKATLQSFLPMPQSANNKFNQQLIQKESIKKTNSKDKTDHNLLKQQKSYPSKGVKPNATKSTRKNKKYNKKLKTKKTPKNKKQHQNISIKRDRKQITPQIQNIVKKIAVKIPKPIKKEVVTKHEPVKLVNQKTKSKKERKIKVIVKKPEQKPHVTKSQHQHRRHRNNPILPPRITLPPSTTNTTTVPTTTVPTTTTTTTEPTTIIKR